MQQQVKNCLHCSAEFPRRARDSDAQWMLRAFCSVTCSSESKAGKPVHLRFWDCVEKTDECWIWTGTTDGYGYGVTSHFRQKIKAHRLSYEMRFGPIPPGLVVRHKCDNPCCVNPNHLELGTQKDNVRDAVSRGRLNPVSRLNLRPGAKGHHGAGPISNMEKKHGRIG